MGFSRQQYWNGFQCPPAGDLPDPGIEPVSPLKLSNQPTLSLLAPPHPYLPAAAKSLQSCPTLCDPIDSSPQGSPVPGILQARTLEWVAISFSISYLPEEITIKALAYAFSPAPSAS